MNTLANPWRKIGSRLYTALGIAVMLTLISAAVGVYYFERSGDLSFLVKSQSVPVLEASWAAAVEVDGLRHLGSNLLIHSVPDAHEANTARIDDALTRLQRHLSLVNGVETLKPHAELVYDGAYDLANVVSDLSLNRVETLRVNDRAANLRTQLDAAAALRGPSDAVARTLERALQAENQTTLDGLWTEFSTAVSQPGADPTLRALGEGEGIFAARALQLNLQAQTDQLVVEFDQADATLQESMADLLEAARARSSAQLDAASQSFDDGRVLLAIISVASVVTATLVAWLWVGNGLVARLSRLSERMRDMAAGDLETPVPEVGGDEIGELADALEVFRQQALEVQRLNLVEQLYGELREANAELQRVQDRLVAQEKLAALGELVSGVAHEISNPLNFVKNFSEGSKELYGELSDMLRTYRDEMSPEDAALLDDISEELTSSLDRVQSNGGRALAIVERMRGLGVVGGDPAPTDLNLMVRQAVEVACDAFREEWEDFDMKPELDLDGSVGQVPLVGQDFSEAVINLVSNACFAMRSKRESGEAGAYEPRLKVSTAIMDGMAEVRVRDNGTGIAEEDVSHIFNPFFTTREGTLGAGLGLSIAADVARRAGGNLTVDTEYGEFTEFTLSVPAPAVTADNLA